MGSAYIRLSAWDMLSRPRSAEQCKNNENSTSHKRPIVNKHRTTNKHATSNEHSTSNKHATSEHSTSGEHPTSTHPDISKHSAFNEHSTSSEPSTISELSPLLRLPPELRDLIFDFAASAEAVIFLKVTLQDRRAPSQMAFAVGGLSHCSRQLKSEYTAAIARRVKDCYTIPDTFGRTLFAATSLSAARIVLLPGHSSGSNLSYWGSWGGPTIVLHADTQDLPPSSSDKTLLLHQTSPDMAFIKSLATPAKNDDDLHAFIQRMVLSSKNNVQIVKPSFVFMPHDSEDLYFPYIKRALPISTSQQSSRTPTEMKAKREAAYFISRNMESSFEGVDWSGFETKTSLDFGSDGADDWLGYGLGRASLRKRVAWNHSSTVPAEQTDQATGIRFAHVNDNHPYTYAEIPRPSLHTFLRYCIHHFQVAYDSFKGDISCSLSEDSLALDRHWSSTTMSLASAGPQSSEAVGGESQNASR